MSFLFVCGCRVKLVGRGFCFEFLFVCGGHNHVLVAESKVFKSINSNVFCLRCAEVNLSCAHLHSCQQKQQQRPQRGCRLYRHTLLTRVPRKRKKKEKKGNKEKKEKSHKEDVVDCTDIHSPPHVCRLRKKPKKTVFFQKMCMPCLYGRPPRGC